MNPEQSWKALVQRHSPRRAPATLEFRVAAELERRAVRPWWLRGFAQWPVVSRAAFLAISGALIYLSFGGAWMAVLRVVRNAGAAAAALTGPAVAATESAGAVAVVLGRLIPSAWLYVLMGTGALLYAALFGLSAAAYRTLYLQSSPPGIRS